MLASADRISYDKALKAIPILEDDITAMESKKTVSPESLNKLSELRQRLKELFQIRDELEKTLTTEIVRLNLKTPHIRVIKEAIVSFQPVSPKYPFFLGLSFLAAVCAGGMSYLPHSRQKV